ncbi:hypothetical protein [uncultured Comamonas sp.]|uniref:hypothetical protein n=1 Tax=uncultured Comamonas sp. TaxID=114710 RepID=UPI0025ED5775|nr:hypothetical protein [uncultured Comamonas sp.]
MQKMKTCSEIRHENLLKVIEEAGSLQVVADRLDKSHAQISQLKTQAKHSGTGKPRVIGDDMARLIEEKFQLEIGWMDNPHGPQEDRPIPLQPSSSWPFKISPLRLRVLNEEDLNEINIVIRTLVETRERDSKVKSNIASA